MPPWRLSTRPRLSVSWVGGQPLPAYALPWAKSIADGLMEELVKTNLVPGPGVVQVAADGLRQILERVPVGAGQA